MVDFNYVITKTKELSESEIELKDMNLSFLRLIFPYLEEKMLSFLEKNKDDLSSCEFLIPDVLQQAVNENYAQCKILHTTAKWEGVTYKEDKEAVVNAINKLIDEGIYPKNLWND